MVNGTRKIYPVYQIKGSAPDFDMKRLKKIEGRIDRNVLNITIKMKTTVHIYEMIKIIKLHRRNFNK